MVGRPTLPNRRSERGDLGHLQHRGVL